MTFKTNYYCLRFKNDKNREKMLKRFKKTT